MLLALYLPMCFVWISEQSNNFCLIQHKQIVLFCTMTNKYRILLSPSSDCVFIHGRKLRRARFKNVIFFQFRYYFKNNVSLQQRKLELCTQGSACLVVLFYLLPLLCLLQEKSQARSPFYGPASEVWNLRRQQRHDVPLRDGKRVLWCYATWQKYKVSDGPTPASLGVEHRTSGFFRNVATTYQTTSRHI